MAAQLEQASKDGYVTVAFGLRVRTPILKQTLLGKRSTPYEASAESRTAGNALGQSYGLLNNHAAIEFQKRLLASKYRYDVRPIALIHDALYFDIPNSVGCVAWVNNNLIECMQWQELDAIKHPKVKLGAQLEIYFPTWGKAVKLPNRATKREIVNLCNASLT